MAETLTGGCLCGAIRFELSAPPGHVAACHCNSCRKHTGAPAAVFADVRLEHFTLTGAPIAWFESSPGARRGFCPACGSTLAYRGENLPEMIHIHIGAFDRPDLFAPAGNENTGSRLPWLHLLTGD